MSQIDALEIISQQVSHQKDSLYVDLWYPRSNPTKNVVVGLVDVRAADDIRISYDFERDGWIIEQASKFEWPADDLVCDPGWKEVAFVQAWAREEKPKSS